MIYIAKRTFSAGRVKGKLIIFSKGKSYEEIPISFQHEFEKKEKKVAGKKVETASKKPKQETR